MSTTDTLDAQAIHDLSPRQRIVAIVGASSGNLVEWFVSGQRAHLPPALNSE